MLPSQSKISIVMPTFNGMGTIELAFDSIFNRTTYPNFELIVVDDGSTDNTGEFVSNYMAIRNLTNLRYTRLDKNYGICTALNAGFEMAGINDIVRVDNDVEVVTEDWLEKFLETAYSEENIGIVHCCPILDDGDIHAFEIKTISADAMSPSPGTPHDAAVHNRVFEVEAAWLMCGFIKNQVVKTCTNDEAYNPVWIEDIDYCLQARKAGFKVMCNQNIKVLHHHSLRNREELWSRYDRESVSDKNRSYIQGKWWGLRVPVNGPGWKDEGGLGPDYEFIGQHYDDCPEIIKFIDKTYHK